MADTPVMQRRTHNGLAALQRKLERLELDHLRQLALAQHNEIESLREKLRAAEDEAHNADIVCNMWRDIAEERQAATGADITVGITRDGQIGVVHAH